LLERFWEPFIKLVEHSETSVSREEVAMARDLGTDPVSGKPMSVRMGRFGPFVQIGTKDDADKPKFAGLRPGQKMDTINFEQAIELFKLPRKLGQTAAGEEIVANVGRFGPYVKYGTKYVSLKTDDPYEVSLERALEVIKEKEIADANRLIMDFPDAGIQVLNGRYGPYITDKQKNAKIPKDRDPKSLTLEQCQALLAAAPVRTFGKWGRKKAANAPAAKKSAGKAKKGATEAAETGPVAAPVRAAAKKSASRLAAKGKQAAVDKKAPGGAPLRPKAKPKAKKSAAKQKS
jgi:DNA topoisomerase-1